MASPPSAGATLHPSFGAIGGGAPNGDRGPIDSFSTNASAMASPGFRGPLGRYPPGAADARRLPTQGAVKRKVQRHYLIGSLSSGITQSGWPPAATRWLLSQ